MDGQLEYGDVKVPIYRENIAEMYIALKPPEALPYMVVPRNAENQEIVDFLSQRVETVERLRAKMIKRFEKSRSERCGYATGDIAYVMGRPFMLQVNNSQGTKSLTKDVRGRVTAKCSAELDVSLITIYVVKSGSYEQAKSAFLSYATSVVLKNAMNIAGVCCSRIMPNSEPVTVRIREIHGKMAKLEGKNLWLSPQICPYPLDCLVYEIWNELMPAATIPAEQARAYFEAILPGWKKAGETLANRAKPYSNQ